MNLDEIQALWDEDSKIDQDELHVESTKIPSLHAKYYKIYNNLTLLKKVEEIKLKQAKAPAAIKPAAPRANWPV